MTRKNLTNSLRGAIFALALAPAALQAQFDFSLGRTPLQVHSFGSQGFAYSDQNNYLTMKTSSGSFAMTDAGANMTAKISDRFRVGAQVYVSNTGDLNRWHPQLDWALADYKFKDWFGVRAGKVKTALGLFNDTQDMQFLHTWALLPQSLYPVDLRDNFISHLGGDVYGDVSLRRAGSLGYTLYAGKSPNNRRGGYFVGAMSNGQAFDKLTAQVYGADLRWNTRVPGLMIGTSMMKRDLDLTGRILKAPTGQSIPAQPFSVTTDPEYINSVYADFSHGKLRLNAEYRNDYEQLAVNVAGRPSTSDASTHGWFASGSYKVAKRLEVGSYYSAFYVAKPTVPVAAGDHIFDKTVSARIDLTRFWHLKIEGHFIDGYGDIYSSHGFYRSSNPAGFQPTTNLLIVRSGFNF